MGEWESYFRDLGKSQNSMNLTVCIHLAALELCNWEKPRKLVQDTQHSESQTRGWHEQDHISEGALRKQ